MRILSIGNSYSQDAGRYIHDAARSMGLSLDTMNLYIGGCSLYQHYRNDLSNDARYTLEWNGSTTGVPIAIRHALSSNDFDVVTLQQVSYLGGCIESYSPYIEALAAVVRTYCPHAKLLLHKTWGYKEGSSRLAEVGYASHDAMFEAVSKTYDAVAEKLHAGILPSGNAVQMLSHSGLSADRFFRDDIHMSYGLGRFTLALTWIGALTGADVSSCRFADFDETLSPDEIALAKKIAAEVTGKGCSGR